jgi:hypothetical protein
MSSARLECAASRLCISGTGLSRRSEERYRQCRRQALEGSGGPWWGGGRCRTGAAIIFSAGDLVGHLNCRYLTSLDLKVARGELAKPSLRSDPTLDALAERGEIHEQGFVEHLAKKGATVTIIPGIGIEDESVARTRDAMARGDAVIVQAALRDGVWSGRADVLRRGRDAKRLRRLVLRGYGYQARPRDQGQHRPAAQPLFGPVGARAAGSAGNGLCRDARDGVSAGGLSRRRFCRVLPPHQAEPGSLCGGTADGRACIPSRSLIARSAVVTNQIKAALKVCGAPDGRKSRIPAERECQQSDQKSDHHAGPYLDFHEREQRKPAQRQKSRR